MLVDDTPANLRYLQDIIRNAGHRVVAFPDGAAALAAAERNPPEIILLDILMPDMDGFEVCNRLKRTPRLADIPVLFLSALSEPADKARAFSSGGVDYITKPFQADEVLHRVDTHLRLSQMTRQLEAMVEERTAELAASNQSLRQEMAVRKELEKQQDLQRALLQAVFEGITEPLLLVDSNKNVLLCNRHTIDYYQTAGIDITSVPMPCHDAEGGCLEKDSECKVCQAIAQGSETTVERHGFVDPQRFELVAVYPIQSEGDHLSRVIIRIADITDKHRMNEEMAQTNKLIALGTLIAGVAHEINNPNQVISINTQIIDKAWQNAKPILDASLQRGEDFVIGASSYSQLKDDIPQIIAALGASAERIARIVSVLKDYSGKNDTLLLKPVAMAKILDNAILMVNHKIKKCTDKFIVHYGDNLPLVNADQHKLEQVFVNLLINAVESLPSQDKKVVVTILYVSESKRVVVEISDEGVGIPADSLTRIMDPFYTTKQASGGTGLGLGITQRIIKQHGGTIEVQSTEGVGSTFSVLLPGGTEGEGVGEP
ncbi:response regulator [Desulfogranum marinum]|uniref:response regulator n=1 Tax=Desulfogranum marinum TaxID=453220 RepID=UPI001964FBB7|nr:response regulator [Desulfogranum marinum]MBM9515183.1 response regulator [Desulfogranum marinum]